MSNIVVTTSNVNVNVAQTLSNITVTDPTSNVIVANVTSGITNVAVTSSTTNVNVSQSAAVSNSSVRQAIGVANISGYGNITYDNTATSNGVIQFNGVSDSDILTVVDNNPSNVTQHLSVIDAGGDGSLTYANVSGIFTYTGPNDGDYRGAISATSFGDGSITYDGGTGVITYTGPNDGDYRGAFSVDDTGGDGSLTYSGVTGIFTYTGPTEVEYRGAISGGYGISYNNSNGIIQTANADIRGLFSNTSPITYDSSTGVFGLEQTLDDLTLVKYQETIVADGTVSGNISANVSTGTVHTFTLNANVTGITLDNISTGGSATLFFTQDGIGGWGFDFTTYASNWSNWRFSNDQKILNPAAGAVSFMTVFYDGVNYTATLLDFLEDTADGNVTVNGVTIDIGSSGNISNFSGNIDVTGNINMQENQRITSTTGAVSQDTFIQLNYDNPVNDALFIASVQDVVVGIDTDGIAGTGSFKITQGDDPTTGNAFDLFTVWGNGNVVMANAGILTTNTISPATNGNVEVLGNLNVQGNLNYVNVEDLLVNEQSITMNYGNVAQDGFIIVDRTGAAGNNAYVQWNETNDRWQIYDGTTTYIVPRDTDDLAEGSTNQYYTDARAQAALSVTTITPSGDGGLAYDNTSGIFTFTPADSEASRYGNANVANFLVNGFGSNSIVTTGDITAGNFIGNGSQLTGLDLNEGDIFLGSTSNTRLTVTPSNNFKTLSNAFDLSNTLTNVNSITAESGNDFTILKDGKLVISQAQGSANTTTYTANIVQEGYSVTPSSTLADTGQAYSLLSIVNDSNVDIVGYAFAGTTTTGSNQIAITDGGEWITWRENGETGGSGFTSDFTTAKAGIGQYRGFQDCYGTSWAQPSTTLAAAFPIGVYVVSVDTVGNTITMSENATKDITYTTTQPFVTPLSAVDTTTGMVTDFYSDYDLGTALPVVNIDAAPSIFTPNDAMGSGGDALLITSTTTGWGGIQTDGDAGTLAGITGVSSGELNGNTYYFKTLASEDFWGDGSAVFIYTDAATTTKLLSTDLSSYTPFSLGGGTVTLAVAGNRKKSVNSSGLSPYLGQGTVFRKVAYGYPYTGFTSNDFNWGIGSSSDWTFNLASGTEQFFLRSRTALDVKQGVFKAPNGMVVGNSTEMSNRGANDPITGFGINVMFDGKDDAITQPADSTNVLPQILFKQYTNNTFQGVAASTISRGGPRLFFTSATGDIDTDVLDQYPRANQELGRMSFWGSAGDFSVPSSINVPGLINANAHDDWTSVGSVGGNLDMHFAATSNKDFGADVFMSYEAGELVLASGKNSTSADIIFAPAQQSNNGNVINAYSGTIHSYAKINYDDVSSETGSKLTIKQGAVASSAGNLSIDFDREYIAGTDSITVGPFFGWVDSDDLIAGGSPALPSDVVMLIDGTGPFGTIETTGTQLTISGVTGPGATNLNGGTFYVKSIADEDPGVTYPDAALGTGTIVFLYTDVACTTRASASTVGVVTDFGTGTGTGNGTVEWLITGTTAKNWEIVLESGADDLKLKADDVTKVTFSDSAVTIPNDVRIEPTYKVTSGEFGYNASHTPTAADTVETLPLNTTEGAGSITQNISISGTGTITVAQAQVMQFAVFAQIENDSTSEEQIDIWFRQNGTDIVGSNHSYTLPKQHAGGPSKAGRFFDHIINCAATDTVEIMYAVSSTDVTFEAKAAQTTPFVRPSGNSISVTVVPIGA